MTRPQHSSMNLSDFSKVPLQLCGKSKDVAPTLDLAVEALTKKGYAFELKFDGVRCMALIDSDVVQLINRRGVDIGFRYPDVIAVLRTTFAGRSIVLDGELVCWDQNGRPDFSAIHRRDAQHGANLRLIAEHPATFMVFDVLAFEGDDIRDWPWKARNALAKVEASRSKTTQLMWSEASYDGEAMLKFVRENALEGLIAKAPTKPYRGGDRHDWIKIKQAFTLSCIVTPWSIDSVGKERPAYTPGKGRRANGIGALELTLIMNGEVVNFGQCGTGFTDADLDLLKVRLDAGELLVVDVEVNAVTKEVKPRFPTFRGVRMDVPASDCTIDQLKGVPVV